MQCVSISVTSSITRSNTFCPHSLYPSSLHDYTLLCITNLHIHFLVHAHSFQVGAPNFLPGPCGGLPIDVLPASPWCGCSWLVPSVSGALLPCGSRIYLCLDICLLNCNTHHHTVLPCHCHACGVPHIMLILHTAEYCSSEQIRSL